MWTRRKNSPTYFQSSLLKNIRNLGLSSLPNMLQSHPIRLTIRVLDRCDDWGCEAPFIPHSLRTDAPVTCLCNMACAIKNRIVQEVEIKKTVYRSSDIWSHLRWQKKQNNRIFDKIDSKIQTLFFYHTYTQTQAFSLLTHLHTATVIVSPSCTRIGARRGTKRGNQENIPGVRIENKKMVSISDEWYNVVDLTKERGRI